MALQLMSANRPWLLAALAEAADDDDDGDEYVAGDQHEIAEEWAEDSDGPISDGEVEEVRRPGRQMEPLKGCWRAPPAQLAAPAHPQARPRLRVPGALGLARGVVLGSLRRRLCACSCSPHVRSVCVSCLVRKSLSCTACTAVDVFKHTGNNRVVAYRRADRTNTRLRRSSLETPGLVSRLTPGAISLRRAALGAPGGRTRALGLEPAPSARMACPAPSARMACPRSAPTGVGVST